MKLQKKAILLWAMLVVLFVACSSKEEFVLGSNLKSAITELALNYDAFDASKTKEESYPILFISSYCQNSRLTFDYLEEIKKENNGLLSREQVEYIQHSLTSESVDFQEYIGEEGVDVYQTSSGFGFGKIVSYEAEERGNEVSLVARLEFKDSNLEGQSPTRIYELDVELVKNAESCFDGYSIKTLTKKEISPGMTGDDKEHVFYGQDMGIEENGVFTFECYGGDDEVAYGTHVEVDLSSNPTLAAFVRENAGQEFEVTYVWKNTMMEPIEQVVPIDIKTSID